MHLCVKCLSPWAGQGNLFTNPVVRDSPCLLMELLLHTSAGFLPCALFHEKKVVLAPQTRGKYMLSQGLRYVCSQWLADIAYLLYLMCSSGRTSTLTSYSREQQKKSKMHLPRIDSFLLKSMFLTLFWAHKDGCWVRMNQKCGCISPGGSCISTHRGGAARLSCVDMPQHKQGFLGL